MPDVRPPLRNTLAESHISAITVAVLLLWSLSSLGSAFLVLGRPSFRIAEYLATAVAIRDIPFGGPFTFGDRATLLVGAQYLFNAVVRFAAAWMLARWVYGEGPLRSLGRYGTRISSRSDA
jgi:hypothetical protein